MAVATDYYTSGPVSAARYNKSRSGFDGILGFFDGVSGAVSSVGRTVGSVADISDDVSRAIAVHEQRNDDDARRDLDRQLDRLKVQRGDNVKLYWAAGAAAVVALYLLAR